MDEYINPPDFMAREKLKQDQERRRRKHFPEEPQRDIMLAKFGALPEEQEPPLSNAESERFVARRRDVHSGCWAVDVTIPGR